MSFPFHYIIILKSCTSLRPQVTHSVKLNPTSLERYTKGSYAKLKQSCLISERVEIRRESFQNNSSFRMDNPFPKQVAPAPKDTVEYRFYADLRHILFSSSDVGSKARTFYASLLWKLNTFIDALSDQHGLQQYIWTSGDENTKTSLLSLEIHEEKSDTPSSDTFCLRGSLCFGENLDDEWLVVWICYYISQEFPQLSITLRDIDGEFLLIEAADQLPEWADPSTTTNRVFIRTGKLYLIPQKSPQLEYTDIPHSLPLNRAIDLLNCKMDDSWAKASSEIQDILEKRLSKYPQKAIAANTHIVRTFLPFCLSAVLEAYPSFIADIVDCFCNPEQFDIDPSTASRVFGLHECPSICSKDCLVPSAVRFTRASYAQMSAFQLKESTELDEMVKMDPQVKALEVGVKIMNGAEVLYDRGTKLIGGRSKEFKDHIDSIKLPIGFSPVLFKSIEFDSDEWMNVSKEEVEAMLDPYSIRNPENFFHDFLNAESPFDGIVMEDQIQSDGNSESTLEEIDCDFEEMMRTLSLKDNSEESSTERIANEWIEGLRDIKESAVDESMFGKGSGSPEEWDEADMQEYLNAFQNQEGPFATMLMSMMDQNRRNGSN